MALACANLRITHRLRATRLQNMIGKAGKRVIRVADGFTRFQSVVDASVYLPSTFSTAQEFRPLEHSLDPCTKTTPLHRGCEYIERRRPFPTQAHWHPTTVAAKRGRAPYLFRERCASQKTAGLLSVQT